MPDPADTPFSGIWPALLTPLTSALDIDDDAFARHVLRLLDDGCTGVTPFGTTGDGPSFTVAERRAAVDALITRGVAPQRLLVSTSCAALPDVVELTRHAVQAGAHGCLMLPPFFLKGVPQAGVADAYRWVIDRVGDPRLRLYLYHIPQVSGVPLGHELIATLKREYPQIIVGLKDSGCVRDDSVATAERFMADVRVYVGNEPDLPELGARGSTGAVSGVANMMPRLVHRLVAQFAQPGAARDAQRIADFLQLLGGYALIPALKGVMAVLDGDDGWLRVRPPLQALQPGELARLRTALDGFGIDRARD